MKHSRWYWLRLAIVLISLLYGPHYTSSEVVTHSNIDWKSVLLILFFTPFGVLFVIGIQVINPFSEKKWMKPSWEINPFFTEPLQFFHFASSTFIAAGIGASLSLPFRTSSAIPVALSLMSIGLSLWFGVKLSVEIYKRKMA